MITLSTAARNSGNKCYMSEIDIGSKYPNGRLEVRSGHKPAKPQDSVGGTLLATFYFSLPAFRDPVNGISISNPITSDTNTADGVAGWFRIYDRDGNAVMDGDISLVGQSGNITFNNTTFKKGGVAKINALNAVVPQ